MLLNKQDLNKALSLLSKDYKVYAPIINYIEGSEPEKKFDVFADGREVALEGPNSVKPPKDVLFPSVEKMYEYKMGLKGEINELTPADEKTVLFGIRPCDAKSIDAMDKVFLTKGYVDSYYAKRRDNVTIVAIGCAEPSRTCFCDSMGLNPNDAPNADVMINFSSEDDAKYVLRAYTEKGKELLSKIESLANSGDEKIKDDTKCSLQIVKADDLDKKLAKMFEHPIWDKVTKGCIGCGTCTYVCPTCYCFDIDSENYGAEGCKYRCWDSCMFSDYTRMAGGANPRPSKKERLRNRYMHKLSYFNERYGQTLCVGCGRCVEKCPSHLDISEFIEKASAQEV